MKKFFLLLLSFNFLPAFAQSLEAGLQIRPRFEYRNGYKTLLNEDQDAAALVSQRSRFSLGYTGEKIGLKFSAQNVHVWGDVPTMRLRDVNGVSFFEAFGQYGITENLMFRVGRQVLSYDNQRILGEVDWAQQGQSHDAALFSWLPRQNHRFDVAVAYNAPAEGLVKVPFVVDSYQNLQFGWYHIDLEKVGFSFLVMNTGYERENLQHIKALDYVQTFGAYHEFSSGNFSGNVAAYGQTSSRYDRHIKAWYGGLDLNYFLSSFWKMGAGAEYLSGTDSNNSSEDLDSFTPLFGTNHAFNGFMDYFYVGNHQHSVGLLDVYGKLSYVSPRFEFSLIPHVFSSAADVISGARVQDHYLGTEVDMMGVLKVRKDFSILFGYSQMFGSQTLELLKNGNSGRIQNWAWLMLNFNQDLFSLTK